MPEVTHPTPEQMWDNFMAHLALMQPLGRKKPEDPAVPHKNFIGSAVSYRQIFLEAQAQNGRQSVPAAL